jgi:hypothetical protein
MQQEAAARSGGNGLSTSGASKGACSAGSRPTSRSVFSRSARRCSAGASTPKRNSIYFFVLLAVATLAYSWRTVIAVGTWTSALWIVGMVWVWWQPDRDPELTARIAAAIGGDQRLFQLISPNSASGTGDEILRRNMQRRNLRQ